MEIYPKIQKEIIKRYFEDRPSGVNLRLDFPYIDSLERKVLLHTSAPDLLNRENPEESNSFVNISMLVPPKKHKDWISVSIMADILGDGPDSKIFKEISQKRGLAYGISSLYNGDCNRGVVEVYENIISRMQEEAIDIIFREFSKLQQTPLNDDELEQRKKRCRYERSTFIESNKGHIEVIRHKLYYGITPEIVDERVATLTPKDIQEAAQKYLPVNREHGKYLLYLRDPLKK